MQLLKTYLSPFKWLELCYLSTKSYKFGIKMKKTSTCFLWYAFNWPNMEHFWKNWTFRSVQELFCECSWFVVVDVCQWRRAFYLLDCFVVSKCLMDNRFSSQFPMQFTLNYFKLKHFYFLCWGKKISIHVNHHWIVLSNVGIEKVQIQNKLQLIESATKIFCLLTNIMQPADRGFISLLHFF